MKQSFRQAVLEDTAVAIDTILIDAGAATTTRPAGLKMVAHGLTAFAGGGIASLIGDLKQLTAALIASTKGNLRAPVWIMDPADALAIGVYASGSWWRFCRVTGGDVAWLADELPRDHFYHRPGRYHVFG